MRYVFLLWASDGRDKWIEELFFDKTVAESCIRHMKQSDPDRLCHYWIQERKVTA